MTMTYGKGEVRRGYFPTPYMCAGACACACVRLTPRSTFPSIYGGLEITSPNLLTSPRPVSTRENNMPQIDLKMLLSTMRLGANVRSIAQTLGIPGSASAVRFQLVQACLDESFTALLMNEMPDVLVPAITSLWEPWRRNAGQELESDIQQLRRIVRAAMQMSAAYARCVEAGRQ